MRPADPPPVVLNDFRAQWAAVRADALAAVDRVGASGRLVLGTEVEQFEEALAAWWGVPYAVGVASGLDALEIGLMLVGVGPGDRVITTPLTAFATTLAILRVGAVPVYVDVDCAGGLDLELADALLRADPAIRAVLPVHLYGHPLDPDGLVALALEHGVAVVEDCAQSAGAVRAGRPTGLAGSVAATSLYPTKNLGALGDGGVVLTTDPEYAARARRLRDYGQAGRYHHVEPGLNSRLDEVQAAILRSALLPRLDGWLARRAAVAARYVEGLDGTALRPVTAVAGRSAHHLFPVLAEDPEAVAAALGRAGVATGRHYPFLCPDAPAAAGRIVVPGPLPVAARLAASELSLPLHPHLSDEHVERVLGACATAL